MRTVGPFCGALLVVLALFWVMQWLVTPPEGALPEKREDPPVAVAPPPPPEPESRASAALAQAPPAPPAVPTVRLSMNAAVAIPSPPSSAPLISVPKVKIGGGSLSGAFGGFAGGGAGGGGYGQGKGFTGQRLVPLSTARPQIPEYAFERGIEGWVEVVFVVTPQGRVRNIRIIDAEPKGVFEAAMIESIQHWIYPQSSNAREVKQKFEFKLGDFQYNWN